MISVREKESLAPYTTFRIGGPAALFVEVTTEEEVRSALALARERGVPLFALGGGSNILVPDEGVGGLVAKIGIAGIEFLDDGVQTLVTAGAGEKWDAVVDAATARGLWGIENLAGIPGTVGGAVVQNIGAYGAALSETFAYADVLDTTDDTERRLSREECAFGYRDSVFKKSHGRFIILRAAFSLARTSEQGANRSYRDTNRRYDDLENLLAGNAHPTPAEVASVIRRIRAAKFPDLSKEGTAGSFFANPVLPAEEAQVLKERFPELPLFALPESTGMKVPIGWVLDTVLHLRGHAHGSARVYEKHALVLVARRGAHASDVDALARDIIALVAEKTGIVLTREVETFGATT